MSGLISELQTDALNSHFSVSDLLRKALVVSKKLDITEMEAWINNELNGYSVQADIPDYRFVQGEVKVLNPYRGWIPLHFGDAHQIGEVISRRPVTSAISELDALKVAGDVGGLTISFSQQQANALMKSMKIPLQPSLHIQYAAIVGLLDAIRNRILLWALELEKKGIKGEGMTFSKDEKSVASQVTYQIVNNIGSMSNSQLQQHSSGSQVVNGNVDLALLVELLGKMNSAADEIPLDKPSRDEFLAEIRTLESQVASPKPKLSILTESLKSARTILEGAAGNALASDLVTKISAVLQLFSP